MEVKIGCWCLFQIVSLLEITSDLRSRTQMIPSLYLKPLCSVRMILQQISEQLELRIHQVNPSN